jgi:hypothetical protein
MHTRFTRTTRTSSPHKPFLRAVSLPSTWSGEESPPFLKGEHRGISRAPSVIPALDRESSLLPFIRAILF